MRLQLAANVLWFHSDRLVRVCSEADVARSRHNDGVSVTRQDCGDAVREQGHDNTAGRLDRGLDWMISTG